MIFVDVLKNDRENQPLVNSTLVHVHEIAAYDSLIETASHLFSRQGFYQTSVEQISEISGISISCLYSYFNNKKDLAIQVLRAINQNCQDYLIQSIQEGTQLSPKKRCMAFLSAIREFFIYQEEYCSPLFFIVQLRGSSVEFDLSVHRFFNLWIDVAHQILHPAFSYQEARKEAKKLIASLQGALLMQHLYPAENYFEQFYGERLAYYQALFSKNVRDSRKKKK